MANIIISVSINICVVVLALSGFIIARYKDVKEASIKEGRTIQLLETLVTNTGAITTKLSVLSNDITGVKERISKLEGRGY